MTRERVASVDDPSRAEVRIVAVVGSLRRHSFNRALVRAAQQLAPEHMLISPIEIGELPFYNADVEAEGDPPSVVTFKASLRDAAGVLIAAPEYNDGIPAVLTNAIDWGSRLPGRSPLGSKPVALIGASPSQVGTARAQLHLRTLLAHVHARTLPSPELLVARAHEKFDTELQLRDEGTRRMLASLLERFASWIAREQVADEAERALATAVASHR
jgi:chromate reductase, NAD(P)H dehydrogenase (quinone)